MEPTHRHHRRRRRSTVLSLLIFVVSAATYFVASPQGVSKLRSIASPGSYVVTKGVDGDTIDVSLDGHPDIVRLIGVDTPETHDPRKPVQCFGQAAADYTRKLVEGKTVRLVADPVGDNRDKYQRLLRYVYLPNGTLLNATLITQGYGFAYTVFPHSKLDEFRADEQAARTANRGLWAGCNVNASSQIKQTAGSK